MSNFFPNINPDTIDWIDIDWVDSTQREIRNYKDFSRWPNLTVVLLRTQFTLPVIAYLKFAAGDRMCPYFVHPYNVSDRTFQITGCVKLNGCNRRKKKEVSDET